jgi:hypothetical protein
MVVVLLPSDSSFDDSFFGVDIVSGSSWFALITVQKKMESWEVPGISAARVSARVSALSGICKRSPFVEISDDPLDHK